MVVIMALMIVIHTIAITVMTDAGVVKIGAAAGEQVVSPGAVAGVPAINPGVEAGEPLGTLTAGQMLPGTGAAAVHIVPVITGLIPEVQETLHEAIVLMGQVRGLGLVFMAILLISLTLRRILKVLPQHRELHLLNRYPKVRHRPSNR